MANYDQRNVLDYRFGLLSAGVTALDTTLTSSAFSTLPSDLSTIKYVPVTLADDSTGVYETVWATAHAANSQSITVSRGREGSTARTWPSGSAWRNSPTVRDVVSPYANRAALPADPHLGMRALLLDEGRAVEKVPTGWRATDPIFAHAGRTGGTQAFGNMTPALQDAVGGITLNAAGALVVPIAGLYDIRGRAYVTGGTGYRYTAAFRVNGATANSPSIQAWKGDNGDYSAQLAGVIRLAAADAVSLAISGGASGSTFGTNGYDGSWIELLYVAP